MTPVLFPLVQQVQREHPERFKLNTGANCFWIVQKVLELSGDPAWGHVAKTAGEGQFTPTGWVPFQTPGSDGNLYTVSGVSHDALFHKPTNQQVDILGGSNDGELPAAPSSPQWGLIPIEFNRVNNPWLKAIPISGQIPSPPPPPSGCVFPPQNESFNFGTALNTKYKDDRHAPLIGRDSDRVDIYVNLKGMAVWLQDYLRLRTAGKSHADAQAEVFRTIDQIPP